MQLTHITLAGRYISHDESTITIGIPTSPLELRPVEQFIEANDIHPHLLRTIVTGTL